MVQQDPVVMADTFLANVTLGRDVSEAQVWQALETVQLADLARGLSDGLAYASRRAGKYAVRRAKTAIGAGARAG
ncbi:Multidrug resistance-like ATP-binding protein mdlB [Salmonella enterica subsp. enterica]|nr:Multidrug resistance-like ATP-binding protein mdlB [Salmonella enterica subsp. enterica]